MAASHDIQIQIFFVNPEVIPSIPAILDIRVFALCMPCSFRGKAKQRAIANPIAKYFNAAME